MSRRWISASSPPAAIYFGDPFIQLATGYIGVPGTYNSQISGIFLGCNYMSISQRKRVWSNFWPGTTDAVVSGTGFDIEAEVIDDPLTVFRVQAGTSGAGGQVTMAMVGNNIGWCFNNSLSPNPNASGRSNVTLDTTVVGTTATYPFRVVDLVRDPPGSNGADPTTAYNWVYVTFNQQDFKAGVTGI
jgi:hypothetical protein